MSRIRDNRAGVRGAGAFTLIEMLVAMIIIAVIIGLLLVAYSHAIRLARRTAITQDVASINMGVQQFKTDNGFLPPLVKDGYPDTPAAAEDPIDVSARPPQPIVYNPGDSTDADFLMGESGDPRYRFSVYSLSYYLVGALGREIDGVEGPGGFPPKRGGGFDPVTNKRFDSYIDLKTGNISSIDAAAGRIEVQDGNGVAYRYYRWMSVPVGHSAYDQNDKTNNFRMPSIVQAAREGAAGTDAEYAIVAAGPNGLFGEIGVWGDASDNGTEETIDGIESELGKRFRTAEEAEAAARADNVVETGS